MYCREKTQESCFLLHVLLAFQTSLAKTYVCYYGVLIAVFTFQCNIHELYYMRDVILLVGSILPSCSAFQCSRIIPTVFSIDAITKSQKIKPSFADIFAALSSVPTLSMFVYSVEHPLPALLLLLLSIPVFLFDLTYLLLYPIIWAAEKLFSLHR